MPDDLGARTDAMAAALNATARSYIAHSGPNSDERERSLFTRDLHSAALRYARAYYAEAREFGLILERERGDLDRAAIRQMVLDAFAKAHQKSLSRPREEHVADEIAERLGIRDVG